MLALIQRHLTTIVVAFVTAAITVSTPAIAQNSTNADTVDGFHAVSCKASVQNRARSLVATCPSGYLPSGIVKEVPLADSLNGFPANQLVRMAYASSTSSTTLVGKNGRVVTTSITVPTAGMLLVHASSDNYNQRARDLLACSISVDNQEVLSSRRWFVVNEINSDDDCATDGVVPITTPGTYTIGLDAMAVDSKTTAFGRTVLWALFEPFDGGGVQPQP